MLVKGSDYFIEACARLAKRFAVSDLVIGLTFVAVGTSLPELASSITAALKGHPGIIVGNVVGSNIANVGLIIGFVALMVVLKTAKRTYERDAYILILSIVGLYLFAQDNLVTRLEGIALLTFYVAYIIFLFKTHSNKAKKYKFRHFMDYFFGFSYITTIKNTVIHRALRGNVPKKKSEKKTFRLFEKELIKDTVIIITASLAIIFGAKYLIEGAIWFGSIFSLPENLIGLSIVAIGTSLPELAVSISAVRKGFSGMVIGNVIGSNIANILLIFGLSSTIMAIPISQMTLWYTIPVMALFSAALVYFISTKKVSKTQGEIIFVCYILFMIFAFLNGWS